MFMNVARQPLAEGERKQKGNPTEDILSKDAKRKCSTSNDAKLIQKHVVDQ